MKTIAGYNILKTAQLDSTRMPKYRFVEATLIDGVISLVAYSAMTYVSDGNEIQISFEDNNENNVRDCILTIDVPEGITAPTITWLSNFHPRTDADSDFKCEAGKNVYWISEYMTDEFVVARWSETSGGNIA